MSTPCQVIHTTELFIPKEGLKAILFLEYVSENPTSFSIEQVFGGFKVRLDTAEIAQDIYKYLNLNS